MRPFAWCVLAAAVAASPSAGQEVTARSRIVSVGVFKNGLAVVKREVQIPRAGTYRLDAVPEPVHGSFWVESNARVEATVKLREVEVPLTEGRGLNAQSDLAGKKVTLHFHSEKLPPVTGTVVKLARPERPEGLVAADLSPGRGGDNFLILQTDKGRLYVNPSGVMMIQAEEAGGKVTERRPVLLLNVAKSDQKPAVYLSYLTNGLAWAPSYRLDVTDPKTLTIEMAAVLRNEMGDLQDAEVRLISGFPSVEFAGVTSPLSAHTSWAAFFQQVAARDQGRRQGVLQQQVVLNNAVATNFDAFARPDLDLGATPSGEGVDLHYEPIGKRTLLRDEALSLTVGQAKAGYERVVEWTVGTSPLAARQGGNRPQREDELWDVLLFKNPFQFPMTTAPALVVEDGRFNGQRTSTWANVGEEVALRVTRALSLRALSREEEDASKPHERVVVGDRNHVRIFLKGELRMSNHRKEPVKLIIRHAIPGTVHEVEGDPKLISRQENLDDVNLVHEALWTVRLAPGEEKALHYKFSVLVYR